MQYYKIQDIEMYHTKCKNNIINLIKIDKIELLYEYRMRLVNVMKSGLNNGNGTIVHVLKIFLHKIMNS